MERRNGELKDESEEESKKRRCERRKMIES